MNDNKMIPVVITAGKEVVLNGGLFGRCRYYTSKLTNCRSLYYKQNGQIEDVPATYILKP